MLAEMAGRLCPLEIKSGTTLADDWFKAINRWSKLAGEQAGNARLVYGGAVPWKRGNVEAIPWRRIEELAQVI